jgi:hypothetical protein
VYGLDRDSDGIGGEGRWRISDGFEGGPSDLEECRSVAPNLTGDVSASGLERTWDNLNPVLFSGLGE